MHVAFRSPVPSRLGICAKGLSGIKVRDRGCACPGVSTETDSSGSTIPRESGLKRLGGVPDLQSRTGQVAAVHLFLKAAADSAH